MITDKFTPAQVEEALANRACGQCGGELSKEDDEVDWTELHYSGTKTYYTPIGYISVVEAVGGSEGDGEAAHLVVSTARTGQFFKKEGYYQSYDGLYLDGELREVQETEKTVKVYE